MQSWLDDCRFVIRILSARLGPSLIIVLTLTLAIGANTVVFSILNSVFLKPLSYPQADQLVVVWATNAEKTNAVVSPADFLDWKEQTNVFQSFSAIWNRQFKLSGFDYPEQQSGAIVSSSFFETLRVEAFLGQTFTSKDNLAKNPYVIVLSHRFWESHLSSKPDVLGDAILLDDVPFEVLGVMPASFSFPRTAEFWIPPRDDVPGPAQRSGAGLRSVRGSSYLETIARLKPKVTLLEARAALEAVSARLARDFPDTNSQRSANVVSLYEEQVGSARTRLFLLFGIVTVVLIIACLNISSIVLSGAISRQHQIAVQLAHGIDRNRLIRQLLIESLLLALIGGALGFLAIWLGLDLLLAIPGIDIPRLNEVTIDPRVFAYCICITILAGLSFGIIPAFKASNPNLSKHLSDSGTRTTDNVHSIRLRQTLIMLEVAFSMILLVGAGLLIHTLVRLANNDKGFDPKNVISFFLSLPESKYLTDSQVTNFFEQAQQRIEQLPSTVSAGVVLSLPLSGSASSFDFNIYGRPEELNTGYQVASTNYFKTMRIPLLEGRVFSPADRSDSEKVAVVSKALADDYWPGENPLGREISFEGGKEGTWHRVVGVVGNVRHDWLGSAPREEVYIPYTQHVWRSAYFVVRTTIDPMSTLNDMRHIISATDDTLVISRIATMSDRVSGSVAEQRSYMYLLFGFGLLSLIIASVGIYGAINYSVNQRTQEIGVRLALGASRGDISRLMIAEAMLLVFLGVAFGTVAALMLTGFLKGLLYNVSPFDTLAFCCAAAVLFLTGALASGQPLLKATRLDPASAIRYA